MDLHRVTPSALELPTVGLLLDGWQGEPWAGHLHPGDLGWRSLAGAEQTASDLRLWASDGDVVAIGMLDGPDLLRLAVDPALADDADLARALAADLADPGASIFDGEALVEARGATALRDALGRDGWIDDEGWIPMSLDLGRPLDTTRLESSALRVVEVGPEAALGWTTVHWSSFKGTPYEDASQRLFVDRWTRMMTGPFADRARSLIAYDPDNEPVAVTVVWTAGAGRPGLVEPMGVHRGHHGRGYAVAITLAGAVALRSAGASSAVVVAEESNPAALASYRSAGFSAQRRVTDFRRVTSQP